MRELRCRLDVALITITHNLGTALRHANRVTVVEAGRIVESGSAIQIYDYPAHPFSLALLRSVPRLDRPHQARLDPVEQPPDLPRLAAGFRTRSRFSTEACASSWPPRARIAERPHPAVCFRSSETAIEPTSAARLLKGAGTVVTS
ncbi:MAG: hypothetical protein J2P48_16950 [Alphaproteobacteria bacterium]|nr:hypothetical protein [Alphaproteobacteria bacterium]